MSKKTRRDSSSKNIAPFKDPEEKLPYVKPELHRLNLGTTEGKSTVVTSEMVFTFTAGSTKPIGPS